MSLQVSLRRVFSGQVYVAYDFVPAVSASGRVWCHYRRFHHFYSRRALWAWVLRGWLLFPFCGPRVPVFMRHMRAAYMYARALYFADIVYHGTRGPRPAR